MALGTMFVMSFVVKIILHTIRYLHVVVNLDLDNKELVVAEIRNRENREFGCSLVIFPAIAIGGSRWEGEAPFFLKNMKLRKWSGNPECDQKQQSTIDQVK